MPFLPALVIGGGRGWADVSRRRGTDRAATPPTSVPIVTPMARLTTAVAILASSAAVVLNGKMPP